MSKEWNLVNDIADMALTTLSPILDRSGGVLYSDANSLRQSPVYLLGHNPGGSPDELANYTIGASLKEMPLKTTNNYLDECWQTAGGRSYGEGQAPLQRRVIWLLRQLVQEPRYVPASNLIFVRSVDVAGSSFGELADLCWKVHETILNVVQPRVLLVFGNSNPSPYTFLRKKFGATNQETIESGHSNWSCRAFKADNDMVVVGVPHLSRYDIIGKGAVIEWIRDLGKL